ncbi:MAG TPA: 4-hydroxyphenylacetate 3-hydroxylase N-terminal domain-containing protein [Chloroflexota bacterium]|nr:4-hydroxyphenylacetate 3-hydroxylase N-terminal domain-containing protein [Chloroflexota bacterium]
MRTPDQYKASLRDGRRVFYRGQVVEDVTAHPVLGIAVEHAALDYAMPHDPAFRELAVSAHGWSRYFDLPASTEDLLARSRLIEAGTRQGKTVVLLVKEIGSDALFGLLALAPKLGPEVAGRVRALYERCRDEDLAMAVAQTDVKGDRSLSPSQQADPDLYLRVVERRSDGIVVRGAKIHTSVSVNANELIVLPTRAMTEADADYALAFATPLNAPGLSMVASPYLGTVHEHAAEHPLSGSHKMIETLTMFDDVFVPWERVFLCGEWQLAGELARGFVEIHRFTAISYKLPLVDALVGCGLLAARVNGLERAGHVRDKLSWLIAYAETLRALTQHAATRCKLVNGVAVPDTLVVNIAKLQFAQGLHTAMQYVQDIAGGLLVTYPASEDLEHPEYGAAIRKYLAGAGGTDGAERLRIMQLISDLTAGEYAGYHTTLAIHAEGSIEAEKLTILAQYPREEAIGYARWLAGLPPR